MAVRVPGPLVAGLSDAQLQAYASTHGLPRLGGQLYARKVIEDVRRRHDQALRP
jgi:hypothetical protein